MPRTAKTYFRAVGGITERAVHHAAGEVFVGSPEINAHYDRTEGLTDDGAVLYVKATKAEYDAYEHKVHGKPVPVDVPPAADEPVDGDPIGIPDAPHLPKPNPLDPTPEDPDE